MLSVFGVLCVWYIVVYASSVIPYCVFKRYKSCDFLCMSVRSNKTLLKSTITVAQSTRFVHVVSQTAQVY